MTTTETQSLVAILAWYAEAGVDSVLDDVAVDWLDRASVPVGAPVMAGLRAGLQAGGQAGRSGGARGQPSAGGSATAQGDHRGAIATHGQRAVPHAADPRASVNPPSPSEQAPARRFPTAPPDAAEADARQAAQRAQSLDELRQVLDGFEGCALKATAKSLCFFRGAERARLAVVGEAPGRDDDFAGRPFVGREGQFLDKMLAAIGLGDDQVHITNIVYWRPPGNRKPTLQEAMICRPFLERQIELVDPDVILVLGGAATKALLGVDESIMRLRGRWKTQAIGGRDRRVLPSLHPDYLLQTPASKRQAWSDLLALKLELSQLT